MQILEQEVHFFPVPADSCAIELGPWEKLRSKQVFVTCSSRHELKIISFMERGCACVKLANDCDISDPVINS